MTRRFLIVAGLVFLSCAAWTSSCGAPVVPGVADDRPFLTAVLVGIFLAFGVFVLVLWQIGCRIEPFSRGGKERRPLIWILVVSAVSMLFSTTCAVLGVCDLWQFKFRQWLASLPPGTTSWSIPVDITPPGPYVPPLLRLRMWDSAVVCYCVLLLGVLCLAWLLWMLWPRKNKLGRFARARMLKWTSIGLFVGVATIYPMSFWHMWHSEMTYWIVDASGGQMWSVASSQGLFGKWSLVIEPRLSPPFFVPVPPTIELQLYPVEASITVPFYIGIPALTALTVWCFWLDRRREPRPGFCPKCDYNLTGNVSGICPECGSPISSSKELAAEGNRDSLRSGDVDLSGKC